VRKDDEGFRSLRKTLRRFTRLLEREQQLKSESKPEIPLDASGDEKDD
jgi:hypothetical protein